MSYAFDWMKYAHQYTPASFCRLASNGPGDCLAHILWSLTFELNLVKQGGCVFVWWWIINSGATSHAWLRIGSKLARFKGALRLPYDNCIAPKARITTSYRPTNAQIDNHLSHGSSAVALPMFSSQLLNCFIVRCIHRSDNNKQMQRRVE